jgi:hypothetical protein
VVSRNKLQQTLTSVQQPTVIETNYCIPEKPAAAVLGVSVALLRKWRRIGQGPFYLRLGNRIVRYRWSDLQEFMDASAIRPAEGRPE